VYHFNFVLVGNNPLSWNKSKVIKEIQIIGKIPNKFWKKSKILIFECN
jgi:hypothetical protein